VSYSWWRQWL